MRSSLFVWGLVLALAGCDDEIQVGRGTGRTAAVVDVDAGGTDSGVTVAAFRDEDFVEGETNRDPFRNYAFLFVTRPPVDHGPTVKLSDTGVDEMRLIGIVSGVPSPYAMILDRNGVGQTVRRGEFVGRGEVVQVGGTEQLQVTLHWRVDRIRPSEVVLTREDPSAPNRPPLTRVIPLRDSDEEEAGG